MKKKYALVCCHSGEFVVLEYINWERWPYGCIVQMSDNERELLREAYLRNQSIQDSCYESL